MSRGAEQLNNNENMHGVESRSMAWMKSDGENGAHFTADHCLLPKDNDEFY